MTDLGDMRDMRDIDNMRWDWQHRQNGRSHQRQQGGNGRALLVAFLACLALWAVAIWLLMGAL